MTNCRNIIFAFLLACSLLGTAFAQPVPPWYETGTNVNNPNVEIDSISIYYRLINEENANANYGANVAGMIIGGGLTGLGIVFLISAATSEPPKTDKSKSFTEQFGEGIGYSVGVYLTTIAGIIFTFGGVPLFIYNINKYSERKGHAEYRDAYKKALDQYLSKKHSMRLMVTPAVNLLSGGGGINAVLQF